MHILLLILSIHLLSCGGNEETISDTQTFNANIALSINEINSYNNIEGIYNITNTDTNVENAEKGVCYSSTCSSPTINDKVATVDKTSSNTYTYSISDLQELTTYYIRPFIKYDNNISYGETISCKTLGSSSDYYTTPKTESATNYDGYEMEWNDEFNIDGTPSADWTFEQGFVRNEEQQWYQSDNASVKDGCLVIEGRKETVKNPNYVSGSSDWKLNRSIAEYTSSSLTTKNSHNFMYGRFEIRAKIPTSTGSWPAIWLLGNTWEWPMNGEIDIMEFYIKNGAPSILANACWSSDKLWTAIWDESVKPFADFTNKDSEWANKYHIWRMDWDKTNIRIYVDGELLNEIDLSQTYNQGYNDNKENPFTTSYKGFGDYILLNLALGSNGGVPDVTAFPLKYKIDYVRVYKQK